MRKSGSFRRTRSIQFGAILAALILSLSVGGIAVAGSAGAAALPAPTGIAAAASTDNSTLGGAVPAVLVAANSSFTLTVSLLPAGATFNTATTLDLTASLTSGARPAGVLSLASVVMPAGVNTATFSVSYSAVDNGVQVTVAPARLKGKTSLITPGTTAPFDVLKVLDQFPSNDPRLAGGLGVGDAGCTQISTESECGTLVLSHGTSSQNGALSLGACTTDLGCTSGSEVVQFIADLGTSYSPTDPALLIIRCSKKQCPGGGVKSYTVKLSFSASGPLDLVSAPCASKGVALDGSGNPFCTDYVQSHRDNAGDLLLYVLFTQDMRGST